MKRRTLQIETRTWPLTEPFVISRGSRTESQALFVSLSEVEHTGRGEACGVRYRGETMESMRAQLESIRGPLEGGVDRAGLQKLLPPGGARNAVDAALWDLEAKRTGRSVWQLAGVERTKPACTAFTIGIRSVAEYETRARELAGQPWIKIKVNAEEPVAAIAAVRGAAPRARLVVDPNQAWSLAQLVELAPRLAELKVDLLEQPIPGDDDAGLEDIELPLPLCADEPARTAEDVPRLAKRYDFVNIKLDKCGGLTAGLELAAAARAAGMRLMVGCMVDSSLAIAPALVVAQLCEVVDLDGPWLLAQDWPGGVQYRDGEIVGPAPGFWG